MQSKFLIVANWKANNVALTSWLQKFRVSLGELVGEGTGIEVAIAPPTPSLFLLEDSIYELAAQDVSIFPAGPYTGEVTAEQLKEFAISYCLIGHSERRKHLGETTEMVAKKLAEAVKNGLVPIICAQTFLEIPSTISNYTADQYYVMYEPAEAISTEGNYHAESAQGIKETLTAWVDKLPKGTKFLYGGSVNEKNVATFLPLASDDSLLNGFVVGHASLDPDTFFSIITQCHSLL